MSTHVARRDASFRLASMLAVCVAIFGLSREATANSDPSNVDTGWPGGKWQPPPPTYGMTMASGLQIVMDDGVILHANVGYPTDPATQQRQPNTFPEIGRAHV